MVVGILTLELYLSESLSLKCKRKILKSLLDKIKIKFNVAVAEVDKQNQWKQAVVGIACISNEASHAYQIISSVVNFIEKQGTVELLSIKTEIL
jgi:uncharacterized protein YlxP (DUF503 family)